MTARPYQVQMRQEIGVALAQGHRAVLAVLATGGGKTHVIQDIAQRFQARKAPVLIVAHRNRLIQQASAKLREVGVPHGFVMPGAAPSHHHVDVASIQTVVRRLDRMKRYSLIIPDEAHHSVSAGWKSLFASQPHALIVGFTATPERGDGRGLDDIYQALVLGPQTASLVDGGYLVPCEVYAPAAEPDVRAVHTLAGDFNPRQLNDVMDRPHLVGKAVEHYERLGPGETAVVFTTSVAAAENSAAEFRREGWRFEAIHGGMPLHQQDAILARLASGRTQGICACDLISEGYDIPAVSVVIMLRPTQSLGLYLQMLGRGMRPAPGKTRCLVLDHAGNVRRHGMPDETRAWTLAGVKRSALSPVPATRQCPQCFAVHRPQRYCVGCGYDYSVQIDLAKRRHMEQRAGQLERITAVAPPSLKELLAGAKTFEEVDRIRVARNYNPKWTEIQMRFR